LNASEAPKAPVSPQRRKKVPVDDGVEPKSLFWGRWEALRNKLRQGPFFFGSPSPTAVHEKKPFDVNQLTEGLCEGSFKDVSQSSFDGVLLVEALKKEPINREEALD
jgi:hypothetical protein